MLPAPIEPAQQTAIASTCGLDDDHEGSTMLRPTICSALLLCSCKEPAGAHVVVHLPILGDSPAEFGIVYANGMGERFDDQLPVGAFDDPFVFDIDYGEVAVDGAAQAVFSCRPDPARHAQADFVVDLNARTTVEMTLMLVGP